MLISRNRTGHNLLLAGLGLILGLTSCYENTKGCLDVNSTNYDVTADIACDDCCIYPTLSLTVGYSFGEEGYNRVDPVTNDLGQEFVIADIKTYFSKISLSDDSNTYTIEDKLSYVDSDGEDQEIVDDIVLATPSGFRYTLGTFTQANTYNSMSVKIGVPSEIDEAQSFLVESDHPLAIAGDSLYINDQNRFVTSWVLIQQIGVHETLDTIQVAGISSFSVSIDDLSLVQQRGSSLDLNLKIDYERLISGIDYNTMTKSEVTEKVNSNLADAVQSNF